jgi:hypothetical protein
MIIDWRMSGRASHPQKSVTQNRERFCECAGNHCSRRN